MRSGAMVIAALMCAIFITPAWAGHTLSLSEQQALKNWLRLHSQFRLATDADCSCPENIQRMRAGNAGHSPVRDYHPYVATGDFNSDGFEDFAVEVVNRSKPNDSALLVFNGPFGSKSVSPAFFQSDFQFEPLFFGPPRPKPYRLVIGPFNSDNGVVLVPHGKTYRPH